jgi:hypothetical protein
LSRSVRNLFQIGSLINIAPSRRSHRTILLGPAVGKSLYNGI